MKIFRPARDSARFTRHVIVKRFPALPYMLATNPRRVLFLFTSARLKHFHYCVTFARVIKRASVERNMPDPLQLRSISNTLTLRTQQCFHKNRPITCPESEWCHHQYTFYNFAAQRQANFLTCYRLSVIVLLRVKE